MKLCRVEGCGRETKAVDLCAGHNNHILRYGEIRRSTFMPNEVVDCGDYYELVLYDAHLAPNGKRVKVSKVDYPLISEKRFYYSHGYAKLATSKETTYLHQFLQTCEPPLVCDHINQDKLDCRRENLRCVTRKQNMENMSISLAEHRWGNRLKKHVV